MANLVVLRRELVHYGRLLGQRGLIVAAEGNLSVRFGGHAFLVTPSGVAKDQLRVQDLVEVDQRGRAASGRPTSEWPMHREVYARRPDVRAVCHAHPPWATAMGVAGRSLDGTLLTETAALLPSVPLAVRAEPGTEEVADSIACLIETHDAILLGNHGVLTAGADPAAAFGLMETVERLAQVTLLAEFARGADGVDRAALGPLMRPGT